MKPIKEGFDNIRLNANARKVWTMVLAISSIIIASLIAWGIHGAYTLDQDMEAIGLALDLVFTDILMLCVGSSVVTMTTILTFMLVWFDKPSK